MLDKQPIAVSRTEAQLVFPTLYAGWYRSAAEEVFKHYPNGLNTLPGAESIDQLLKEAVVNTSLSPKLTLAHTEAFPTPENVIGIVGWQGQALLPRHYTLGALCVVQSKRGQNFGSRLVNEAINQIVSSVPSNLRSVTVLLEQGGLSTANFYSRLGFRPWRNNIMYRDVLNPRFAAE